MENIEDIIIEGIGNLRDFDNMGEHEIRSKIPNERYALYTAASSVPEGWPKEIMQIKTMGKGKSLKEGENILTDFNCWYYSLDGMDWEEFYLYDLTAYRDELKLIPGFIYERKIIENKTAYFPVVSLLFSLDGKAQKASKSWCDRVIESKFKKMF